MPASNELTSMLTAIRTKAGRATFIGLALIVGTAAPAAAQIRDVNVWFDRHGADVLRDKTVGALIQDTRGYLWIGTNNGLYRFDGYGYTSFEHDPQDPNSLYDTTIHTLALDGDKGLWIGTFSGVEHYDASTGRFRRIAAGDTNRTGLPNNEYPELLVDRSGYLWAGSTTRGLFRIDPSTDSVRHFEADLDNPAALTHNDIDALYEDRDGTLWVATGRYGLHRYDVDSDSFKRIRVVDTGWVETDGFNDIVEDSSGTFWFGGWGLVRYDPVSGDVSRFIPQPDLPRPTTTRFDNYVDTIVLHGGDVWAGTSDGLVRFDVAEERFQTYRHAVDDETSLPNDIVNELYLDDRGKLWVATIDGGLAHAPVDGTGATRITAPERDYITCLAEDSEGGLWIGFEDRFIRYDPLTGGSRVVPFADFLQSPGECRFLTALDSDPESLWFGMDDGFLRQIDNRGRILKSYRVAPQTQSGFGSVTDVAEAAGDPGALWTSVFQTGLCRLDLASGESACFEGIESPNFVVADPLADDIVWAGSPYTGLYRFDTNTRSISGHFVHTEGDSTTLSIDFVQSLHASRAEPGILWVGTWTGGLNRFDTRASRVTRQYTSQNSDLPHNIVNRIAEQSDGTLWLPTADGLARLDPATGAIRDRSNALGGNRNVFRILVADNGALIMVGMNVVHRFPVASIDTEVRPPRVHLTDITVNDEVLVPGPDDVMTEPAWAAEHLVLPFERRDVSFGYLAPDFENASAIRYAYHLDGYDERWHLAGSHRRATYTNLPPGKYTFRVRASRGESSESASTASIQLTIRPPWWRTIWAYLAYGLVFAGFVVAVDRTQRRRLIRRERERTRERELQQAREIEKAYTELKTAKDRLVHQEKLASLGQLTAGIAHEIKNPLNFINNFAEVNAALARELREAYDANPDAKLGDLLETVADIEQNAAIIGQHGTRADSIVRNMMQHASGGTGSRTPTDINKLVAEHVDLAYHGKRAQIPDLRVEVERDLAPDTGAAEMVPQEIGRVVMNLLSNAFDAVHAHSLAVDAEYVPEVRVATSRDSGRVVIRVSDNGPGIPADVAQRIFEPFFTTKPTGVGTGLGLSMSHEIVTQGHGGSLTVTSEPGAGATFEIVLPGGSN